MAYVRIRLSLGIGCLVFILASWLLAPAVSGEPASAPALFADSSAHGTRSVTTQSPTVGQVLPGPATLISPSGTIVDPYQPHFYWNAVSGATWYYFWLSDSVSASKDASWHNASACGADGVCSTVSVKVLAPGPAEWWIQTYNESGYGPWSAGSTFTVTAAAPPVATLISPSGSVGAATPTYTWNAVSSSTWYYLWVHDSGAAPRIAQWYSPAQAGCFTGTGVCSIKPSTALVGGAAQWWIQTWNSKGYGPWSAGKTFTVTPPPAATLISPSGPTSAATPTYAWNAVDGSTWYYLWVSDSGAAPRIAQWYTDAQAGCAGGAGMCSVTPGTAVAAGNAQWWIQTWSPVGYGPWSAALNFSH